ncbi:MAG: mycothiol synthase, partial [Thermocrispum sp.]
RGFARVRELHRMGLALPADLPPVEPPPGATLRAFRPGVDEQPVVQVNARAFSWHPEQGAMTVADVEAAEAEDRFDPAGLIVAVHEQRLVGFHWTKVHGGERPVGEVYVVGVDPDAHGGGLGRALTVAGLVYLQRRGLRRVILYVEGDNAPALAVYRRLGFDVETTAVQYEDQPKRPEM